MAGISRNHVSDVRGASRMLLDASAGVVDVVERMHRTIQRRPGPLGQPIVEATQGITGFVYRSIRGSMRLIGQGLDASLAPVEGLLPAGETTPGRNALVSILNGVYGDYLVRTANPLAIEMGFFHDGLSVDAHDPGAHFDSDGRPAPTGKILVFVHGLCMSVEQWTREGYSHGAALAEEQGWTPLYLRYNSGLHIAENGRRFAELLEQLVARWPGPVEEIAIVGHSMGGLVARSACLVGEERRQGWLPKLRRLVFLGTPHHGAPLERGGHGLDYVLQLSPYSAPFTRFGKARSAGIRDLRHGSITPGSHRVVPLPKGVDCFAMAATVGTRRSLLADRLVGDGLVPLDSALGRHAERSRSLRIPKARQWIGYEMGHLELLHRAEVYAQLSSWLSRPPR
ncbi:MAG: alpha/beta hydrolase [Gammaproteobacteria bacterium]|nr:alpha/beta hydrolase [Gammaproteobacteria bacterium]